MLATREVTHLARHVEGVRYRERGSKQFKGLAEPVPVVQVLPHAVDAERQAAFHAAVAAPRPDGRRARGKVLIAIAVAAVFAVVAALVVVRTTRDDPVLVTEDRVDVVNPGDGKVIGQVLLDHPSGVAAGVGSLWVASASGAGGTVSRLDVASRRVISTVDVGGQPGGLVVAGGSVWVTDESGRSVSQINPEVNRVVARVPVGNRPTGIGSGRSGVWVANTADGTVTRIAAGNGTPSAPIDVGAGPTGVAVTGDTVWVTNTKDGTVSAIDGRRRRLRATYPVGSGPTGIAAVAGSIWVVNSLDGSLARLDPESGAVSVKIPVGNGPSGVAGVGGKVWVSNEYGAAGATLVRVDPGTNRADLTVRVGGTPRGLAATTAALWVTAAAPASSHRGGTLRVLLDVDTTEEDPATVFSPTVFRMTNDGLLALRPAAGAAGTSLVPDLATAMPAVVDGGRTYSFRLRKGIRYSTGKPVRASDIRRAIERQFRMPKAIARNSYSGIRGGAECIKSPRGCDLSRGIETDDATGSVTFRLLAPDPEFLYKLALPAAAAVPRGTPDTETQVPATGPYQIATRVPGRSMELVRNPHFREWSHAAQPEGYPDRIVIRAPGPGSLDEVLSGKSDFILADFTAGPFSGRLSELKTRYPAQLHRDITPFLFQLTFDTGSAPFSDVRARRALSYAIDRRLLQGALGGNDAAQGSCQVLPPAFPGYAPYCPYGHDPDRALSLVAQSGTRGDRVTILVPDFQRKVGAYVTSVLTFLGYRARLEVRPIGPYFEALARPGGPQAELTWNGWGADYPAASGYLATLFSCRYADQPMTSQGANIGRFCDRDIEHKIDQALALQQAQPAAAGRLWQEVDRAIVDEAALLPLGFLVDTTVTSRRVGNYVQQPGQGVPYSQLWIR